MEKFLYLQPNSLPTELCKEIICLFEKETDAQYLGITSGGYKKHVKNTLDLSFPEKNKNLKSYLCSENLESFEKIKDVLYKELSKNVKKYISGLKEEFNVEFFDKDISEFTDKGFLMHKYFKNQGKFTRHHDFFTDNSEQRVIVFLWYLNDVEEGGETQIFEHIKIKPETGKLLLFPAQWCFPHCGIMPLSDDKYIITGWLYLPTNHTVHNEN